MEYSLVSKKWNKYISKLISNSIVDNNLIEFWFTPERSKKLLITFKKYKPISLEINKEYSIIKIEKKTIADYFNKKVLMINPLDFINCNKRQIDRFKFKFNKIIIELFGNEIVYKYINRSSNFENCINDNKIELNIKYFSLDENEFINFGKDTKSINVNEIQLFGANELQNLDFIRYFQPKHLLYDPNGCYSQDSYFHMDYSPLFNPEIIGERIESIKITGYSDHVEPYCLKNMNQLKNLHTLSIPILCHDLIKHLSGIDLGENGCDYHYGPLEKTKNIKEDWEQMIQSIVTCKSLKNLTSNFCSDGEFCLKCDDEYSNKILNSKIQLSNGIKKLLKSDYLYYLKFDDIDFVEESTFSPLLENFSLKVLVLKFRCLNHMMHTETYLNHSKIIKFILSNKLNINHLKISLVDGFGSENTQFDSNLISIIFNTLIYQQINNMKTNLYSIGLVIQKEQFDQVLNYIKLLSDSSIKTTNPIIKELYLSFNYPIDVDHINSLKNRIKNIDCKKGLVINIIK
ncbi:hypothetical protein ACTA71_011717 [Dictyostelium dimigraforme]